MVCQKILISNNDYILIIIIDVPNSLHTHSVWVVAVVHLMIVHRKTESVKVFMATMIDA